MQEAQQVNAISRERQDVYNESYRDTSREKESVRSCEHLVRKEQNL